MTTLPEEITITCPKCGERYKDWYRPSMNLTLDDFDDDYIEEASSVTCPSCKTKVRMGSLVVDEDGTFWEMPPIIDGGSGQVRDKEKVRLSEIIQKVNELFEGDLTDNDKLQYVDSVIKEKLLESEILAKQATSNTKEQFAGSPDLGAEVEGAIIDALDAHTTMSTQALESKQVQREIIKILLNHSSLYEDLRKRASAV